MLCTPTRSGSLRNGSHCSKQVWVLVFIVTVWNCVASLGFSADTEECRKLLRRGEYASAIAIAKPEVDQGVWNELWPRFLLEAYLQTGAYEEAIPVYEGAIQKFSTSIRLRMLGAQVYRMNNQANLADEQLAVIPELIQRMPWRFSGKDELVPLGEFFVLQGEDPKQVLEICYDRALKVDPKLVEAHVASGRLALDKYDYQVAADALQKALKLDEQDPEIHYLLARTFASSDSELATKHLVKALEINPHHVSSLLLQAENRMGAEAYEDAKQLLNEVEKTNSKLPKLWALRSAIAHLEAKYQDEGEYRKKALKPWALNPEVDYVIGKHLSEHYRFEEAVTYQTRALEMSRSYLPALSQLAQDLLRLGRTEQGWKLVNQVREKDPYDVSIFNLKQLEAQLAKFATLEAPGFVIRMDAKESRIYGQEVVALLSEARNALTKKFEVELEEPIFVEIFPRQKDFAIRTFGMPGGAGFLGVCFGRLITANSPSALRVDSNWKSVLWHEYCHVVTLQKTKNKMPRWLSEGISVYEERQRDPRWGQSMDPTYRKMILGKDLVPVSQLSAAFLNPKTPMHLQFAYFESSMVVEYWIQKYGIASLRRVLNDLSVGMPIHQALARDTAAMDALDQEFEAYLRGEAKKLGTGENREEIFDDENLPEKLKGEELLAWLESHPRNYWVMKQLCEGLIASKQWEKALPWVERLRDLFPEDREAKGIYARMAEVYRELGKVDDERKMLSELVAMSPDAKDGLMRLVEIDSQSKDWASLLKWVDELIAIDPMRPSVQEVKAKAAEAQSNAKFSQEALQALAELDPVDPAGIQFRLARAYQVQGDMSQAKRHVLQALEESPRYREALQLLRQLQHVAEADPKPTEDSKDPAKEGPTR